MKKFFTTLLVLTGFYFSAFSQEKGDFELGINVGYNAATVRMDANANSNYRNGLNVGAFGDYFFSDRWSIKAKLTYDQKGWDRGYINFDGQNFNTDYHVNYLTVPIMASWHFGKKRNWYLNFGPYAGFLLSVNETRLGYDLRENFQKTDLGFDLGIGVKIPVAKRAKLLFELDGQGGITDIFKNNEGSKVLNSRSSLNVGMVFDLK